MKAGIQKNTGFRVEPGMTNRIRLRSSYIATSLAHRQRLYPAPHDKNPSPFYLMMTIHQEELRYGFPVHLLFHHCLESFHHGHRKFWGIKMHIKLPDLNFRLKLFP